MDMVQKGSEYFVCMIKIVYLLSKWKKWDY